MRLYHQLLAFMVAATLLPTAALGWVLLTSTETQIIQRIRGEQVALARAAAVETSATLMDAVESLGRSAELLDWSSLGPEEQQGALTLLYEQSPLVSAVLRVSETGAPLSPPVARQTAAGGHPAFAVGSLETLLGAVPARALALRDKGQVALSAPFEIHDGGRALALAVKLEPGAGGSYAVAQVHMKPLEGVLERVVTGRSHAWLTDAGGRVLAHTPGAAPTLPDDGQAALQGELGPGAWLASGAALPGRLGLSVVVAEGAHEAFAPVHQLRRSVLISMLLGVAVLLVAGALFTRRITRRVSTLAHGAEVLGSGDLSMRIALDGADELSALAETFNRMGGELESAQKRLMGFNDELQRRVKQATAELEASQAMLVEAQKLAAVGQLGAGVAHEINNPLAGILGHAQLLLMEKRDGDPDIDSLKKIEQAARRVKEITANLLRFSQQRQQTVLQPMDLRTPIREALGLLQHQLEEQRLSPTVQLPEHPVHIQGDPGQLSELVLALVHNAMTAMSKSERRSLTLSIDTTGTHAELRVADTGRGIPEANLKRIFEPFFTTKDVWSNVGLGLSVSYRVAMEHHGTLEVESREGEGACFTLRLPLR
ncbi:MAG TPA: HAMP domain-containing sensor histidine kinase [Myxococcaceae bacterium]|nr:HAMP domain-containing sensor histidine kinase [Myxococcaceae bacterium]